jgi:transcriptional regulator with PAS, ATPase and Fis domain
MSPGPATEPSTQERVDDGLTRKPRFDVLLTVGGLDRPGDRVRMVRLEGEIMIGRGRGDTPSSWHVDDETISRRHAVIAREGRTVMVTDLGSRNGTWVGRSLLRGERAPLKNGTLLVLGGQMAVFRRMTEDQIAAVESEQEHPFGPVPTASPAMAMALRRMRVVGGNNHPLLLAGETGTGKEVYARALHRMSGRPGPFVAVNCASLSRDLFESHLFGYKRGSHSQAREDHPGILSTAERGTLFLDEIGEMDPALQVKLVRFPQDNTFLGLGWTRPRRADVRIIAATQRPEETVRLDILGRMGTHPFVLPPLRRRKEDLPALCRHFLGNAAGGKRRPMRLERSAGLALCLHRWPKNVRELEATILEGALLALDRGADRIGLDDLPALLGAGLTRTTRAGPSAAAETPGPRRRSRPRPDRAELERLLREHGGNVPAVARQLARHRELVWRWIKSDGIDPIAFRRSGPPSLDADQES